MTTVEDGVVDSIVEKGSVVVDAATFVDVEVVDSVDSIVEEGLVVVDSDKDIVVRVVDSDVSIEDD